MITSWRCTNVIGGICTRQIIVLNSICVNLPSKKPLRGERLLENTRSGSLFAFFQCDIKVTKNLRETFANFAPIFKNINVDRDNIRPFMKSYAEKERLLTQPRRMLISSYFLDNGTTIPPLLLFYLDLGLVGKKNYRSVKDTPMKFFNSFVQSAVNATKKETRIQFLVLWQRQRKY